jgi:hypothetical protein
MPALDMPFIIDGQYIGGVDSLLYPTDLVQGTYAWGVNIVNRGGVVQTRPGKRRIVSFCGRKAQGHYWARTMDDRNYELVAIDGLIYWSQFPFKAWAQLPNVNLRADVDTIWMCNTIQAAYYNAQNDIELLTNPRNIVFFQDGYSQPCYWQLDNFQSGVVTESYVTGTPAITMPIGTAMAWQDNRLWIAQGDLVFVTDLLNPAANQESEYLAEQTGFRFPRAVMAMTAAPVQGLLVGTPSSMHTLMSYIQDRTQWQTTQGFQSDVSLEVGPIAPWGWVYLHGMLWIYTARGVISYDRALTQNLTTVILTADGEMQRSKQLLAPDCSGICMGAWENVLQVGVPASCIENRHTWIMDAGIAEKLNNTMGMCWVGIWVGSYPVQFTSPIIGGTQHNYELAYSAGFLALNPGDSPSPQPDSGPLQANIHLWENFIPNQIDDVETAVNCSLETRAFLLTTDDYYRFVFAEFMIVNLKGVVPVQVYVTGLAGNYQKLFETTLRADAGPFGNTAVANGVIYYKSLNGPTTLFENYRRQVRHLRTKKWVVNEQPTDGAACVEIDRFDGIDKAFQLMIQWQGRMGIRQIKFFYDRQLQSPQGYCPVDESTTPHITLEATA